MVLLLLGVNDKSAMCNAFSYTYIYVYKKNVYIEDAHVYIKAKIMWPQSRRMLTYIVDILYVLVGAYNTYIYSTWESYSGTHTLGN